MGGTRLSVAARAGLSETFAPSPLYWRPTPAQKVYAVKFQMAQNSIFAILLRSPWWISAAIALLFFLGAAGAPHPTVTAVLFFAALPFVVLAAIAAWKQRHLPSTASVARVAEKVQAMSWQAFANELHAGFRRDGCEVTRLNDQQADFCLRRKGRLAVVGAKRWKASQVGVQPLRELHAARQAHEGQESLYVTLGDISDAAKVYAKANQIQFITASELARLLPELAKAR